MAVTIKRLAQYCGLSVSTVSKALNGYSDISEETRQQVQAAADALGDHASAIARSLKTGRSYNLGVVYSDDTESGFTHSYFAPILQSFKQEAERRGYDITFIAGTTMPFVEHCRFRGVDGICIVCTRFDDPEVARLIAGDFVFNGCSCIQSENRQGMELLMRHVLAAGHRRIAYVHGEEGTVTEQRIIAYRRAMAEAGLPIPAGYLQKSMYHNPVSAREATLALLSLEERPTCILMPDDYAALGGMDAIRGAGLSIPSDISIAGFDGVPLLQMCVPRLTTVRQDTEAIGIAAAKKLIHLIERPEVTFTETRSIPCRLIEGDTVDRCAAL